MEEKILKQGAANWFHGIGSKGGKLVLTNETLYFEGHLFNAGKKEIEIELEDIEEIKLGFPKNITIFSKIGKETFSVNGGKDWKQAIEEAIKQVEG